MHTRTIATTLMSCFLLLPVLSASSAVRFAVEYQSRIDINTASTAELMELNGVGPVIADEIVRCRPYETIADIVKVDGIGEEKYEGMREQIKASEVEAE